MAIATTATKLSLSAWAKLVGIHPLHFAGVSFTPDGRNAALCEQPYPQYDWQAADRVSREQIAMAIAQAEDMMERSLGFRLIPTWEVDEWRPTIRPYRRELTTLRWDSSGRRPMIQANWGHFISGGVEEKTPIDFDAAIVWDADKLYGTVTVTGVRGFPECEVEAYYPGKAGEDTWQIRPISVSISDDTATITFGRELAVIEELLDTFNWRAANRTDDDDFLEVVDVYRRRNDPSTQATLMWEPLGGCYCNSVECTSCSYGVAPACLFLRSEPKLSMVAWNPGEWDADLETFVSTYIPPVSGEPDIIRLYYRAGYEAKTGCTRIMDTTLARAVAFLALSLLDRSACDCSAEVWEYWHEDMAHLNVSTSGGGVSKAQLGSLDNPFGTTRGAIYAWKYVLQNALALPRVAVA